MVCLIELYLIFWKFDCVETVLVSQMKHFARVLRVWEMERLDLILVLRVWSDRSLRLVSVSEVDCVGLILLLWHTVSRISLLSCSNYNCDKNSNKTCLLGAFQEVVSDGKLFICFSKTVMPLIDSINCLLFQLGGCPLWRWQWLLQINCCMTNSKNNYTVKYFSNVNFKSL